MIQDIAATYENTVEWHDALYNEFTEKVNTDTILSAHKAYGDHSIYGDRPFHQLWNLLVQEMPKSFKFLEIGVFKGQILSLIGMLAAQYNKNAVVVGISPFDGAGDKYSIYPSLPYRDIVMNTCTHFGVTPTLITGRSSSLSCVGQVQDYGAFDLIYIDGSHDYDDVIFDILTYGPLVSSGGYLVMDDSSTDRNMSAWNGHEEVGKAVQKYLDVPDSGFTHKFALGHIRLFQRV